MSDERSATRGSKRDPGDLEVATAAGAANPFAKLWWLILVRGCISLALGLSVILSGVRRPALANFIGLYWLVGAALTIRWALTHRRSAGFRLGLAAGIVGVIAASVTLARASLAVWLSPDVFVNLLGAVVLSVGLMRVAGAMRDDQVSQARPRLRHRLLIGALDSGLGILLLATSYGSRQPVIGAVVWALVGGTVLVLDALSLRRLALVARGVSSVRSPP